jgi:hypothetical protein
MATVYSDVRTDLTQDDPREVVKGNQLGGEIRVARATYETSSVTAGDTIEMFSLPQRARIVYGKIFFDDLGTGVNLDVGFAAYTDGDSSAVSADPNAFKDGIDASSAAGTSDVADTLALNHGFEVDLDQGLADNEFVVTVQPTDADPDDAKTIELVMFYVVN